MERVEKMANSYSKELKAEVTLLALKNEITVKEISERFSVSLDRVREWRNEALNNLALIFDKNTKKLDKTNELNDQINRLHKKVGELTMENDILKKTLHYT